MTKDEAVKIVAKRFGFVGSSAGFSEHWVDTFIDLGMLKLDEPKSANVKPVERDIGFYQGEVDRHADNLRRCAPAEEGTHRALRQCAVRVREALRAYERALRGVAWF